MRVRMEVSIAGQSFSLAPGEETDRFSDAEAIRLISAGYAVPCAEERIETTTLSAPPERRGKRKHVVSAHGH